MSQIGFLYNPIFSESLKGHDCLSQRTEFYVTTESISLHLKLLPFITCCCSDRLTASNLWMIKQLLCSLLDVAAMIMCSSLGLFVARILAVYSAPDVSGLVAISLLYHLSSDLK